MGIKDQVLKEYLEDCLRYADLMNGTVFGGRQIVQAEFLKRAPRRKAVLRGIYGETKITNIQKRNSSDTAGYFERERDMLMLHDKPELRFYLACEGQAQPDYVMPVRNFAYDAIEYSDQIKYKEGKEYSKSRKPLIPVLHVVLYLGEKQWLSKHSLLEMMDIPENLKEYIKLLPEYKILIVDIHNQDPRLFRSEWKAIFEVMSFSRNREELKKYIEQRKDKIRELSLETRRFLAVLLDQYDIMDDGTMEVKEMCEAWDGAMLLYKEEGKEEGRAEAWAEARSEARSEAIKNVIELCMETGLPLMEILSKVEQKFHLSQDEAENYRNQYLANVN